MGRSKGDKKRDTTKTQSERKGDTETDVSDFEFKNVVAYCKQNASGGKILCGSLVCWFKVISLIVMKGHE